MADRLTPQQHLDKALGKIEKELGKGMVHPASDSPPVYHLPFTSPHLNYATEGGAPWNRYTALVGEESSGKSMALYELYAMGQALPHSMDSLWRARISYHRGLGHTVIADRLQAELDWVHDHFPEGATCCVTGDTLVAVADGRNAVSIKQLAEEGREVDVYASDDGRTTIKKMRPRLTRRDVDVVLINLDDGSSLRCTSDHKIMLWNGQYKAAGDLVGGDSLMRFDSVCIKKESPRRYIWMGPRPKDKSGKVFHDGGMKAQAVLIAKNWYGEIPSGTHIHHDNEDALDDRIQNLIPMLIKDHLSMHARLRWQRMNEDDLKAISGLLSESTKRYWDAMTPEERSQVAYAREENMEPGLRSSMMRSRWDSVTAEERSEFWKKICASMTPEQLSERARLGRANMTDEERKLSGEKSANTLGPEGCSERARLSWANRDPETRNIPYKEAQAKLSPEARRERALKGWETRRQKAEQESPDVRHNHRVVSVVPDGREDVYCGEVDDVHNFSVITSVDGDLKSGDLSGITIHNCHYDIEQQFDPKRAAKLGVDIDKLYIVESNIIEEICETVGALWGAFNIHGFDSTSNATSTERLVNGKGAYGPEAKQWKYKLRDAQTYFGPVKNGTGIQNMLVMIHQMSTNVKTGGVQQATGKYLKFASSCSIEFSPGAFLWKKDGVLLANKAAAYGTAEKADEATMAGRAEADGREIYAKIVKSRTCRPFRTAGMQFDYKKLQHVSVHELASSGLFYGVITKSGSWYTVAGEEKTLGQGMKSVYARLADDEELRNRIMCRLLDFSDEGDKIDLVAAQQESEQRMAVIEAAEEATAAVQGQARTVTWER